MGKEKEKTKPAYREVKPKLGLGVRHITNIGNPHDDLIKPEASDLRANLQTRNDATDASLHATDASLHAELAGKPEFARKPDDGFADLHANTQTRNDAKLTLKNYPSWQDKVHWNHRIQPELYDELLGLARDLCVSLKELNEIALIDLVKKYHGDLRANMQTRKHANTQGEPLIKELNKLELLSLFAQLSGKPVSSRNRKLFDQAYKNFHPLLIELGIREAAIAIKGKGGDLYSFTYCTNAMAYRLAWQMSDICQVLQERRAGN